MTSTPTTLAAAACAVLGAADPAEKLRLTCLYGRRWLDGTLPEIGACTPPDRPARPPRPELRPPRELPKRGVGGRRNRVALLHALAHIELNAVDLAWDVVVRFAHEGLPRAFYDDWVRVALDEADHFAMLEDLMRAEGAAYGDLVAHDGLWQAAASTADSLAARLALVPMTLEARGCDTTPATIARLQAAGETAAVPALERILEDEISHVAAGVRWFEWLCARDALDPVATYHDVLRRRFKGGRLKPPFNHEARARAGMAKAYYLGTTH